MAEPVGEGDGSKIEKPPKASTTFGAMFALEAAFPSIEDALKPFTSVDMTSGGTLITKWTEFASVKWKMSPQQPGF